MEVSIRLMNSLVAALVLHLALVEEETQRTMLKNMSSTNGTFTLYFYSLFFFLFFFQLTTKKKIFLMLDCITSMSAL